MILNITAIGLLRGVDHPQKGLQNHLRECLNPFDDILGSIFHRQRGPLSQMFNNDIIVRLTKENFLLVLVSKYYHDLLVNENININLSYPNNPNNQLSLTHESLEDCSFSGSEFVE